eukprot:c11421_g1_i1.p1 GENE.c11421_g1_i1~~c11421_g1_i1.p1  ORF type:complete len:417 (+),score=122.07 c11421_g1_i1:74-1324(+)
MTDFVLTPAELASDPNEVFQLLEKLGEGSYGCVFKAMHIGSGKIVAIKEVTMEEGLEDVILEINIMKQLSDDHIVNYYGNFVRDNELWIVMEYCGSGSVADLMSTCKRSLKEDQISSIVADSLRGLMYLHRNKKIHRDIKAGNILINEKGIGKLADFGVSGQLKDDDAKRNTVIGTPYWMAPEVIQEIGYNTAVDIWSLGITCIEMADSRPPLCNIHPMRAIFMIPARPPPTLNNPSEWSAEFNDFIAKCLVKDPAERPSAETLLTHPFVARKVSRSSLLELVDAAAEIIAEKGRNFASEGSSDGSDYEEENLIEDGTMAKVEPAEDDAVDGSNSSPEYLVKLPSRKQADVLAGLSLDALKALLGDIDSALTVEISKINQKYEKKKAPLSTVLALKQSGGGAGSAGSGAGSAQAAQ